MEGKYAAELAMGFGKADSKSHGTCESERVGTVGIERVSKSDSGEMLLDASEITKGVLVASRKI